MNLKRFHKQPFQDSTTQNSAMDLHFIAVMIFYVTKCEAQGLNLVNYFISYNCFHISLPYFLLKFFYLWICLFTYVDFKRRVALTNYYLLIGRVQSMILLSVFFVFSMFNLFRIFENELNATILNMGCLDVFLFIFTLFYFPHRPCSIAILSPRRIQKNRVNHFGAFAGKTRGVRLKHGLPPPGLRALQWVQVSIASKKKKKKKGYIEHCIC